MTGLFNSFRPKGNDNKIGVLHTKIWSVILGKAIISKCW